MTEWEFELLDIWTNETLTECFDPLEFDKLSNKCWTWCVKIDQLYTVLVWHTLVLPMTHKIDSHNSEMTHFVLKKKTFWECGYPDFKENININKRRIEKILNKNCMIFR